MKNCRICGQLFEAHYGKEVCSEECAKARKDEQNKEGNYRRYHGLSNEPYVKICPVCGKEFEGLNQTYCSIECSNEGRKKIRKEVSDEYYQDNKKDILDKIKEKRKKL